MEELALLFVGALWLISMFLPEMNTDKSDSEGYEPPRIPQYYYPRSTYGGTRDEVDTYTRNRERKLKRKKS